MGERAQVVGGYRRADPLSRVDEPAAEALEGGVASALFLPDRRRPAALGCDHHLVIPVSALDEPNRRWDAPPRQGRRAEYALEGLLRIAEVSLDDDPHRGA